MKILPNKAFGDIFLNLVYVKLFAIIHFRLVNIITEKHFTFLRKNDLSDICYVSSYIFNIEIHVSKISVILRYIKSFAIIHTYFRLALSNLKNISHF